MNQRIPDDIVVFHELHFSTCLWCGRFNRPTIQEKWRKFAKTEVEQHNKFQYVGYDGKPIYRHAITCNELVIYDVMED